MAGKKRRKKKRVESRDIVGLKYFDQLAPLLERLHEVGTERDKAGNRELFMDQYCMLVLLFLFNPVVDSLRGIQQASELQKVQRKLGCSRASLGSLSEATDVFDPQRLREIVEELGARVATVGKDPVSRDVRTLLTAVDGTVIKTLSRISEAAYLRSPTTGKRKYAWRLHMQFDVERSVPRLSEVTGAAGRGKQDEKAVLHRHLESGRCYIMDRGYAKFALFNAIHDAGSNYVCRLRDNSAYHVEEEFELSDEARKAGVVRDMIVRMGADRDEANRPNHKTRIVIVKTTPHESRGNQRGHDSDGYLRIVTDMLDVPPEIISSIYEHRWTIEIFFRFFKHILGCRSLLSTDPDGIEIQTYCAIIACLLISLYTGRKPTKRTYEMICFYFIGWATEDELLQHIEKLKMHD